MPTKNSSPKKKITRRKKAEEPEVEAQVENVEQVTNEEPATEQVMEEALAAIQAESEDIQTKAEEPAEEEKPKRKVPAKKKTTRKKASKVSMDSVAMARAAEEAEEVKEEVKISDFKPSYAPTFAERIEEMRDIKPRQTADATFLVPEKFSFDLTDKKGKGKSGFVRKAVYFLAGIVIVLAVVLVALTIYSNRLLSQESDMASLTNNSNSGNSSAVQASAFKIGFANIPDDLKNLLVSTMQGGLKSATPDLVAQTGLPTVTSDTLFFKASAQGQTNSVLDFLSANGIKAQIQQNDALPDDMVLYLTNPLKNPDLSMLTAAVYNASGKPGDAKRICGILQNYKVVSCQGLNNTSNQTGTTIFYKDQKVVFVLKRTTDFAKATFTKASSDQVEDIRVVAGK